MSNNDHLIHPLVSLATALDEGEESLDEWCAEHAKDRNIAHVVATTWQSCADPVAMLELTAYGEDEQYVLEQLLPIARKVIQLCDIKHPDLDEMLTIVHQWLHEETTTSAVKSAKDVLEPQTVIDTDRVIQRLTQSVVHISNVAIALGEATDQPEDLAFSLGEIARTLIDALTYADPHVQHTAHQSHDAKIAYDSALKAWKDQHEDTVKEAQFRQVEALAHPVIKNHWTAHASASTTSRMQLLTLLRSALQPPVIRFPR